MTKKMDLEAELRALREELSATRAEVAASIAPAPAAEAEAAPEDGADNADPPSGDADPASDESTLDWALGQLDGTEVERLLRQFTEELGDLQQEKPVLTLFGAFLLGYLLGRAR